MPKARIPLVGVHNQRGVNAGAVIAAGVDQRFINTSFDVIRNPVTGNNTVYVSKRPGWGVSAIISANNISTGLIRADSIGSTISAFGDTNSTVFNGGNSVGTITGKALYFTETLISNMGCIAIKSSDGTGWYFMADADAQTAYTGNRTSGSPIITGIASTAGMYVGQEISGDAGIPAGTRILTVDSGTQITLTANATSGAPTSTALTKTPIAKIIDSEFVTTGDNVTAFVAKDGWLQYANSDGYLYSSDLNSVSAYTAANKVAAQKSPDPPKAVAITTQHVVVFGNTSAEFFYNAGNTFGSVFISAVPFQAVGALHQRSVAKLENDIYFVSSSAAGDVKVRRIRGTEAQVISTPEIDKILGTTVATGNNIFVSAFQLGGYSYVVCVCTAALAGDSDAILSESGDYILSENGDNILMETGASSAWTIDTIQVYNVNLNLWCEWDTQLVTFVTGTGAGSNNAIYSTSVVDTGGKIYQINPIADGAIYTDDGDSYTMTIQTSKLDFGTSNRKFVKSLEIVCDEESSGTLYVSWSDDDYATFSTPIAIDLSSGNRKINRLGAYRNGRAYKLTHSDNYSFRAQALDIEYELGTT